MDRLIGQLMRMPRSQVQLDMAEDDEAAEQYLAEHGDTDAAASSRPSLAVWSPEVEYLAGVVDRLGEVVAAVVASAGGKPPRIKPLPRPKSAFDRARERRAWRRHDALVAEVEEAQARWAASR